MYRNYLENEQFNFQINRFLEPYYSNQKIQQSIKQAASQITDRESWYQVWNQLAIKTEKQANPDLASAYYQLADFFLGEQDPRKHATYQGYIRNYYASIDTSNLIFEKVTYQNGYMPVVCLNHSHATRTLIFHGGFDSYLEEIVRLTLTQGLYDNLPEYNFIMFEGPGQGQALRSGLALTPNWEEPVGAILDYYHLKHADLLGMSLGGYLAIRAAAKEPRIQRVIAFDSMYSIADALIMKSPADRKILPKLKDPLVADQFNQELEAKAAQDVDLAFKLRKGMDITLTKRPVDFIVDGAQYTLAGILDEVRQDVLLIGCSKDLYVPVEVTLREAQEMTNARSLTIKILTQDSGGAYHCQVGDKPIAAQMIIEFLSSHNLMTTRI